MFFKFYLILTCLKLQKTQSCISWSCHRSFVVSFYLIWSKYCAFALYFDYWSRCHSHHHHHYHQTSDHQTHATCSRQKHPTEGKEKVECTMFAITEWWKIQKPTSRWRLFSDYQGSLEFVYWKTQSKSKQALRSKF